MHNRFASRKALPLLLLFAMLIVSVAVILPMAVSASGTPANNGEIKDFNYQTVKNANVSTSEETDLRFLFSIDNLDYTAVGFVFSKNDDPVKTDEPKKNYTSSNKAYRSVTADDEDIPAPTDRYWVVAKLSEIPHDNFADYVYIRPYVTDGSGTRYGETKRITVCEALGHVHEIKNPTGTATLLKPGTRCGNCAICGINGIEERDVRAAVADSLIQEKFLQGAGNSDKDTFDHYESVKNALAANQKYYPASENNNEGRDFFFQIDILWNETMLNSIQNKFILCFYTDKEIPLFYFTPRDYADREAGEYAGDKGDNPWSGGFDWTNGIDTLEGPSGGVGKLFDRYPNLSRSGDEQDWGWHRIGVRVHEEAETDGNTVTYSGVFYLYIDGVQRWKVDLDPSNLKNRNALLFTMDKNGAYHSNSNDNVFTFWATHLDQSTSEVQMVTANSKASAVIPSQFSAGVVPVTNPVDSKFVLKNNQTVSAKVWFMEEHDHVWDGNEVLTREATVLEAGEKAEHCILCGEEKTTGTSVTFEPTVFESYTNVPLDSTTVGGFAAEKSLSEIRGSEHFYPNDGRKARNLFFEYSILWNETLTNWDNTRSKSEMKIISFKSKNQTNRELFLLYSNAEKSQYCPFANHFDFSTGDEKTYNDLNVVLGVYDSGFGGLAGNDQEITEASSPSIGAYGWHHIGVLVHLEATGSGSKTNYLGWSALYVDGVKVWKIKSDTSKLVDANASLFKADSTDSQLEYSDTNPTVSCRFDWFGTSGDSPAYAVLGNVRGRIVDTDFDPTTEIEPVVSPAAVDYVIPGTSVHVNGAVYFKAAD